MPAGNAESRIAAEARRIGIDREFDPELKKNFWVVRCTKDDCHNSEKHAWEGTTQAVELKKRFRASGWIFGRRGLECASCFVSKRRIFATKADQNKRSKLMSEPSTIPSIGPDLKIARRVYAKLDEVFDEDIRRYRANWDDEKVAKDLNVAVDFVVRVRVGAYGELAEDPEISRLRDDMELARMEFQEAVSVLTTGFEKKLQELERRFAVAKLTYPKAAG